MADVFERARAGWQATRDPRFAVVAEAVAAREPAREPLPASGKKVDVQKWNEAQAAADWRDFTRLAATIAAGLSALAAERVTALAARNDPRIVPVLLEIAAAPPYTAGSAKKFWQVVVAALEETGNPRAKAGMHDLSLRYKSINDTMLGAWLAGAMSKAAARMKEPAALKAPAAKKLAALEVEVLGRAGASSPAKTSANEPASRATRAQLFARIVEDVDDDDARLVYADALSEAGDERGEHIVLQIARAAGRATKAQADEERMRFPPERLAAWSVPLATAANEVDFERGFPVAVQCANTGLAQVTDAIEWGTVETLTRIEQAPVKALLALLDGGRAKNLRTLETLKPRHLDQLETPTFGWRRLTIEGDKLAPKHLARLPQLVHLEIAGDGASADILAAAPTLESVRLATPSFADTAALFAKSPNVRRLELGARANPASFRGLELAELLVQADLAAARGWLDALPALGSIELEDEATDWAALGPLFAAYPKLERVRLVRRRGDVIATRGLLGTEVGARWPRFYDELEKNAALLQRAGFERLILLPEEPRHREAPVSAGIFERLAKVWPRLEMPEKL